jgi:hypothetical protein
MRPESKRWLAGGAVVAVAVALFLHGTERRLHSSPSAKQRTAGPVTDEPSSDPGVPPSAPRSLATGASPAPAVAAPAASPAQGGSTTTPTVPAAVPHTRTVFTARWGGAPGELGRKGANESNPEGPMSFVVDERGSAFVLDQVNGRVEVFEPGGSVRSIPLPSDTFQDVALAKNDTLAVLDRLTTGSVAYVDETTGRVTHEIALAGKGVPEGGDVTALFQRDDGTWVEVKHQNLVRIADGDGNPLDEREIVQGRFSSNGILRASKSGERALFVTEKPEGRPAVALAKVGFELPLWQILSLDTDRHGRIYVGASLQEESSVPPFDLLRAEEVVVVLEANGAELGRVTLPRNAGPEESFRRISVGADGAVYHLAFEETGATLRKVQL